ncbi:hypothetical protein DCM91_12720 [Chitinophaga costaii]|nr:hypothetical protein DCM91_12720 [Chitinophaga costaii]
MLCGIAFEAHAQQKPAAKPVAKPGAAKTATQAPLAKKTDLRFRSTWGIYLSDTLPRPEVIKTLDQNLVVRDQKNNKYEIISFEFTYEQKTSFVNDTTNKAGYYIEYLGDNFKHTAKLSDIWVNKLKETLQRGDELFFSNIIVKYPPDKYYKVPDLRFVIL